MLIEFLRENLNEIITVVTGALVGGQGFFILFKNLKTNKNIDLIDKTVNKLVSGDLKNVKNVVEDVVKVLPDLLEDFKGELLKVIDDVKKELYDQQINVINNFESKVKEIEVITRTEIDRLNIKHKLEEGDVDEDVSNL